MKNIASKLILSAIGFLFCVLTNAQNDEAKNIIKSSIDAYRELSAIEYSVDHMRIYFEKLENDTILGQKFYAVGAESIIAYNGNNMFVLATQSRRMYMNANEYEYTPVIKPFPSISGYFNSILSYTLFFEENEMSDCKLLNDTIMDGMDYYHLSLAIENGRIFGSSLINFAPHLNRHSKYDFYIRKDNKMLTQVVDNGQTTKYNNIIYNVLRDDVKWNIADFPTATEYVRHEYIPLEKGTGIPDFTANLLDNSPVNQSFVQKGKHYLLFFMAVGCGYSDMAFPLINELAKEKTSDIRVVGVCYEEMSEMKDYLDGKGEVHFPIICGDEDLAKAFGVVGFPYLMFINANKQVDDAISGFIPSFKEKVSERIDELTKGL